MTSIIQQQKINFWLISGLCVLRNFQGRGVGEKLVNSICSSISGKDNIIYLMVDRINFRAQNLYKKLGFRDDNLLKGIVLQDKYHDSVKGDFLFLFKKSG